MRRIALVAIAAFACTGLPAFGSGLSEPVEVAAPPLPMLPTGATTSGRWTEVPKAAAGIEGITSLSAIASNGDHAVLAGARQRTGAEQGASEWRAAIWYSGDGLRWSASTHPDTAGEVFAVAFDGDHALAIGGTGNGVSSFVWGSDDAGRTWKDIGSGDSIFGTTAPAMGRPFVDGLLRFDDRWVASGGSVRGYAGVWVSRDGAAWRQVLDSGPGGGIDLVEAPSGSLFGYWTTTGWFTKDAARWVRAVDLSVPGREYLGTVAPGAAVAFGRDFDHYESPTPLLRSSDGGRAWAVDNRFLGAFPDANVWTVTRAGHRWIAAGTSGSPNHVDAWVSTDLDGWEPLPRALYGGAGGTLSLVAEVGGRTVLMGTGPELDRYYTFGGRARSAQSALQTHAVDDTAMTVHELRARPVVVPKLSHGDPCPTASTDLEIDGVGPVVSAGPIAAGLLTDDPALRSRTMTQRPG